MVMAVVTCQDSLYTLEGCGEERDGYGSGFPMRMVYWAYEPL